MRTVLAVLLALGSASAATAESCFYVSSSGVEGIALDIAGQSMTAYFVGSPEGEKCDLAHLDGPTYMAACPGWDATLSVIPSEPNGEDNILVMNGNPWYLDCTLPEAHGLGLD